MNKIDHFKFFILCSSDATADVNHLHVKRIHLGSIWFGSGAALFLQFFASRAKSGVVPD
jgi:hypothetical protein